MPQLIYQEDSSTKRPTKATGKSSPSKIHLRIPELTTATEVPERDDTFQRFLDEVAAKAGPPLWVDEAGNKWYCSKEWAEKEQAAWDDYYAGRMGPISDFPSSSWCLVCELAFPGRPVPSKNSKQIHRTRAGRPFVADNARAAAYKEAVAVLARTQYAGAVLAGPLRIWARATFRTRKSLPDCDGMLAGLWDALQGIIYGNDRQLEELHIIRQIGEHEGVVVSIWTQEENT